MSYLHSLRKPAQNRTRRAAEWYGDEPVRLLAVAVAITGTWHDS
jgi:hypothetical protein